MSEDRQVRLALRGKRRRQRDEDRIGLAEGVVVGGRAHQARVDVALQRLGGDVADVALAAVELFDTVGLNVDEDDGVARFRKHVGEWHADVAGADDGDPGHAGRSV
jgi:hypothetical protein